jgi:membrane protease YdiL (CAAX protease family)
MGSEITTSLFRVIPFAIVIIVFMVLLQRKKITKEMIDLQSPSSAPRFLVWWLGFLGLILVIEYMLSLFGLLEVSPWKHSSALSSSIRIIGSIALAPVAEELLFRGIILYKLSKRMNRHAAIVIQASFFVLLHSFTYESSLSSTVGIVQGLIDASMFAYARYSTNSLYTSITMHATGNAIAILERFIL